MFFIINIIHNVNKFVAAVCTLLSCTFKINCNLYINVCVERCLCSNFSMSLQVCSYILSSNMLVKCVGRLSDNLKSSKNALDCFGVMLAIKVKLKCAILHWSIGRVLIFLYKAVSP